MDIKLIGGSHDGCTHTTDAKPGQAFWVLGKILIEDEQYIVDADGTTATVNK